MRATMPILIALFAASVQVRAETYLCVAEKATGFIFDKSSSQWVSGNFKVEDSKWLLSSAVQIPISLKEKTFRAGWGVVKVGEKVAQYECSDGLLNSAAFCKSVLSGEFLFDKDTLRYLRTDTAGYWWETAQNEATPVIEIGACSKVEV